LPQYWTWESIDIQKVVIDIIIKNIVDPELADLEEEEEQDQCLSDGSTLQNSDTESCEDVSSEGKVDKTFELQLHSLQPATAIEVQCVE
jgi:hypothetical protein